MSIFVNPYNFVPLTDSKQIVNVKEDKKLTGYIDYSILTKTPLFIPNTSSDKAFKEPKSEDLEEGVDVTEHKRRDFFSYHYLDANEYYDDVYFSPVIPGSEIRGMFRNNYEILTQSCMSAIDNDVLISKRTPQVYKPGLIKKVKDGYELYEADDNLWRTVEENSTQDQGKWNDKYYKIKSYKQKDFKEGEQVLFKEVTRTAPNGKKIKSLAQKVSKQGLSKNQKDFVMGYILKGEDGPVTNSKQQKHVCHIFSVKRLKRKIAEDLKNLESLQQVLKIYEINGEHFYTEYHEELKKFMDGFVGTFFPVYYDVISSGDKKEKNLLLSPASMTRETYKNKVKDLIKTFNPCEDKTKLCSACSLFGTVRNGFAVSSRIRFSDLKAKDKIEYSEYYVKNPIILPALSSPKLSNIEFYLQQPNGAKFWTYDYYIDKKGEIILYTPEISGRKFYWHKIPTELSFKNVKASKLNMTIRPVRENVCFDGRLYFEKISEKELKQLIWLLNAGDKEVRLEDKKYGYKLGAAKPLGLGSIATSVNHVILRKIIKDESKEMIKYINEDFNFSVDDYLFDDVVEKNYKKALDFYAIDKIGKVDKIQYPITMEQKENTEGFKWFVENHGEGMKNKRNQMEIHEHLVPMKPEVQEVVVEVLNGHLVTNTNQEGENTNPIEEAKVVSYKNNYNRIRFKIGDQKVQTISGKELHLTSEEIKERYPVDTVIKVQFVRKDENPAVGKRKIYRIVD